VTVVIRSVGERTEAACRNLIAQQAPEDNIVVVSNAPFSATLADSFRAGIEKNLPWTLCVDGDVLVRPDAVSCLLAFADDLPPEVCEVQGLVLDKLFGVRRPAGNHLYRTSLLSKALGLIPPEGEDIRPEFYTLNRMVEQGHPWVETPLVLGLHDFEQYYRDIFRKCYVHARKFGEQMHLLVEYWRRVAVQDPDYRVALWGLAAGIVDTGDIQVDVRRDYGFSKWVADEKWTEKRVLEPGQITPGAIERTLAEWASPGEALERFEVNGMKEIVHGGNPLQPKSRGQRLREMKEELGLTMMLPWLAGWSLSWVGRKLIAGARHHKGVQL
jgi:hypothetical protein